MFRLHQELLRPPHLVHNEPRWSSLSVDALEAPAQLVQTTGGLCVCVCVCPADRSVLTVTNMCLTDKRLNSRSLFSCSDVVFLIFPQNDHI